jgi:thiol-disulfide isomerase/thioredoxin|tara:strand:+ start:3762 stop:4271 length:510 start_codon:yes stop_codon:yes gene_type:complete
MFSRLWASLKTKVSDRGFWISNLITLSFMLIIIIAVSSYQQRNMHSGQALSLEGIQYSEGPTLVYFWGSWCSICLTTSPFVSTLALESEYNIISIALSSGDAQQVTRYLNAHDYHFEAIDDDSGEISQSWGVAVTPSIFIIDTQGDIRFISTGMTSLWGMKLRLWLATL